MKATAILLGLAGAVSSCTWGPQTIKILPFNHGWSFCCPGLAGTKQYNASIKYASVNNDQYSVRPGIAGDQLSQSCEDKITKWYDEDFHSDNFEHTTAGVYGPANFQTETLAMVVWCHNKVTPCQIKIEEVTIGSKHNAIGMLSVPCPMTRLQNNPKTRQQKQ